MSTEVAKILDWKELIDKASRWEQKALSDVNDKSPLLKESYEIADIPSLEKDIKMFEQLEKIIKEERLNITRSFTETSKRLMSPEKSYEEYAGKLKKVLLPLKIEKDRQDQIKQKRLDKLNNYASACQGNYNFYQAKFNQSIQEKITEMYSSSLKNPEMTGSEYIEAFIDSLTEYDFECPLVYNEDENDNELKSVFNQSFSLWDRKSFEQTFQRELKLAFSKFDTDLKDIEKAEEMRKAVEYEKLQQIETKKNTEDIFIPATKFYAAPEIKTKTLKKVYVLDIPSGEEGIMMVLKSFINRYAQCMRYFKGKDEMKIVDEMIKMIEEVKNKELDTVSELSFKQESRL